MCLAGGHPSPGTVDMRPTVHRATGLREVLLTELCRGSNYKISWEQPALCTRSHGSVRGLAPRPSLSTVPRGGPTWSTDMQQLPLSQTAWGWRNSMRPGTPSLAQSADGTQAPDPSPILTLDMAALTWQFLHLDLSRCQDGPSGHLWLWTLPSKNGTPPKPDATSVD